MSILLFHLVWLGHVEPPPILDFVKWLFGFGVALFFTVSAFTLSYGYWGRLRSEKDVTVFYVRRLARILPLYYAMLLFEVIHVKLLTGATWGVWDIVTCAALVFNFVPHIVDGIAPASWSIGVEMVFYLLFPLTTIFCRTPLRALVTTAVSGLAATVVAADLRPLPGMAAFLAHGFPLNAQFFCLGILACHGYRALARAQLGRWRRPLGWLLAAAAPATLWAVLRVLNANTSLGADVTWQASWGISFGLLCIALAVHPTRILANRVTLYLGRISFSLYLCHPPVVFHLTQAGVYRAISDQLGPGTGRAFVACAAVTLLLVTVVASIAFRLIEQPGIAWGQRLAQRLRGDPVAGEPARATVPASA